MIHLVDLSDGVDSSPRIVLVVPIEPDVKAMWFMWSERKCRLVCCIIKASVEWLVTKNQACQCHPQMRRDFCGKQQRQWRISLGIFRFAIFKGSIFFLAPTEDFSSLSSWILTLTAPGCVFSDSWAWRSWGLLKEGFTVGGGEEDQKIQAIFAAREVLSRSNILWWE